MIRKKLAVIGIVSAILLGLGAGAYGIAVHTGAQANIEKSVLSTYQGIENAVVDGYQKIENNVVSGYLEFQDHLVGGAARNNTGASTGN